MSPLPHAGALPNVKIGREIFLRPRTTTEQFRNQCSHKLHNNDQSHVPPIVVFTAWLSMIAAVDFTWLHNMALTTARQSTGGRPRFFLCGGSLPWICHCLSVRSWDNATVGLSERLSLCLQQTRAANDRCCRPVSSRKYRVAVRHYALRAA